MVMFEDANLGGIMDESEAPAARIDPGLHPEAGPFSPQPIHLYPDTPEGLTRCCGRPLTEFTELALWTLSEAHVTCGTALSQEAQLAPHSLSDVEFFVLRHPWRIQAEQAFQLKKHLDLLTEKVYGRALPLVILEEGMSLEPVRSGGWIYTYERMPRPGEYEVAVEFASGPEVLRAEYSKDWREPVSGDYLVAEPYAWRPASLPPPVRRSAPVPAEVAT